MSSVASACEDVRDVVLGDDAEQVVVVVDDRDGQQVAVGQQPRRDLLVGGGADADGGRGHELDHRRPGPAEQQAIQREDAEQASLAVDDVDVVHRLRLVDQVADRGDRLLG